MLPLLLALIGGGAAAAALTVAYGVPLPAGLLPVLDVAALAACASVGLGALLALALRRLLRRAGGVAGGRPPAPWGRALLGTGLLAVAGVAHLAFAPAAPAVIVLVVDCLRADRYTPEKMPELTARLDGAVRFADAHSQSSWTRSAMPSLLSGRYPTEHGLYRTRPPDRIADDVVLIAERFAAAGWMTAAFAEQPQLDAAFGYARGFGRYGWQDGKAPAIDRRLRLWNTLFRSVPRFALAHYLDIHAPWSPDPALLPKDLPATRLKIRPFSEWKRTVSRITHGRLTPTVHDWAHLAGLYDAEVTGVDRELGRLYDALAADGTLDAAWLVFTADHGERFGERGGIGHMGVLDETVLRVPLVIRPPGGVPARTVEGVVQHVDVVPTLLAAAGLPADPGLPGRDLGPTLRGGEVPPAPSFAEEWARATHHASVRFGDHKLLRGTTTAVYDVTRDPGETVDLAPGNPELRARLEGMLAAYFAAAEKGSWGSVDWAAAGASGTIWTSGERPDSVRATASDETLKALEALGYVAGDE